MAQTPIYPARVVTGDVLFATANTNRDGSTGTYTTAYTVPGTLNTPGAGDGAVVLGIRVNAIGTTTAGVVRIWRNTAGTNYLVRELLVSAITPSATVEVWKITAAQGADATGYLPINLALRAGDILKVSTHNAESFHITADIGLY